MWLARWKTLAGILVILGVGTALVRAFTPRPQAPAKPGVPAARRVLRVAEGGVRAVAFGPEGRLAAGFAFSDTGGRPDRGGVVVFDARGERGPGGPHSPRGPARSARSTPATRARNPRDMGRGTEHDEDAPLTPCRT